MNDSRYPAAAMSCDPDTHIIPAATHEQEENLRRQLASAEFLCYVPWLDGEYLINAVGTTEAECHANLSMLDLDDGEIQRVSIKAGVLQVPYEGKTCESGTDRS